MENAPAFRHARCLSSMLMQLPCVAHKGPHLNWQDFSSIGAEQIVATPTWACPASNDRQMPTTSGPFAAAIGDPLAAIQTAMNKNTLAL